MPPAYILLTYKTLHGMAEAIAPSKEGDRGPPTGDLGGSYANGLKFVRRSHNKLKRNVLEVLVEKTEGHQLTLGNELVGMIVTAVEVKDVVETQGNQAFFTPKGLRLEIYLNQNLSAAKYSSEIVIKLSPQLNIVQVKPVMQSDCTMAIWGITFNILDTLVAEMVKLHGGKMLSPMAS